MVKRLLALEVRQFFKRPAWLIFAAIFFCMLMWPYWQKTGTITESQPPAERHSYFIIRDDAKAQLAAWEKELPANSPQQPSIEDLKKEVALLNPLIDLYVSDGETNRLEITKARLDFEQFYLQELENGRYDENQTILQQKLLVRELTELVEKNITEVRMPDTKIPAINRLTATLRNDTPLIWLLFLFVLAVSFYIIEDKRHPSIDFINSWPIAKGWIIAQKQIIFLIFFSLGVSISFYLSFFLPAITEGFGDSSYPLPYSIDGQNVLIMKSSTFLIYMILYFLAIIFFLTSLSGFIQLFTKNILVNLLILGSLVFLSGGGQARKFLPTSYFNVPEFLLPTGGSGNLFREKGGLLVIVLWGLGLLIFNCLIAQRRQRI
ncbi:hypothetical protein [Enterococcus timonensis]|uniref:hypothetical protein n=1 Tax=Enterococcus timonensis TaxID=1852364 RepID=UPI0008DA9863|nr:hypothetical protein [Enterococcus timonensis]